MRARGSYDQVRSGSMKKSKFWDVKGVQLVEQKFLPVEQKQSTFSKIQLFEQKILN